MNAAQARKRIAALTSQINEHDYRYYVLDWPTVSEAAYDALRRELETLRIAGIVTDRDITCRTLPRDVNPLTSTAKDVMTRRVLTIDEDDRVETAARTMEQAHVRRLPVVDSEGHLVGIVSATDLAMKAEEIASGSMFPKVAHHVPRKTSPRFVDWM